ncbi:MAG: sulfoxide reductase heme-binding subunit YedZ, partial [Gammaproteobacteria bacterium]|nr:sulfoxide reductase heme-binding subunit YedZ [Gammaproteobacteria bacterium]
MASTPSRGTLRLLKIVLFIAALFPAFSLVLATFEVAGLSLGANPVEELLHEAGEWGLRFLLITLSITPLRRITGMNWLIRFRRMLGLFAFFYVSAHFLIYAILDQGLAPGPIIEDIVERPYITLGIAALLMLIPLAVTSTNAMMRRLGRRWQQLHYLVYPAAILGVWHFWWQVKEDIREPVI